MIRNLILSAIFIAPLLSAPASAIDAEQKRAAVVDAAPTARSSKIRVANVRPPTPPAAPTMLPNTRVSSCDTGWTPRSRAKLCIDLEDKDSFKPGQPISFKVTVSAVPEGKKLFVSLNRLSIVSLPYSLNPVEGFTGGIPLSPVPGVKPNSETTFTWDGKDTQCYRTDTGGRCNLADNLAAGRYVMQAMLVDEAPSFGESAAANPAAKSSTKPAGRPIKATTRSFAIDTPLDWGQFIREADNVAAEFARANINWPNKFDTSKPSPQIFKPVHENFREAKDGRWCREYKGINLLSGSVKACLPKYAVTEYGIWPGRSDPRKFHVTGQISMANGVPDQIVSEALAKKFINDLYRSNFRIEGAGISQKDGVFRMSTYPYYASYNQAAASWDFFYGVSLAKNGDGGSQDDTMTISVDKKGRACIANLSQKTGGTKFARYKFDAGSLNKVKCKKAATIASLWKRLIAYLPA